MEESRYPQIVAALAEKACLKQSISRSTRTVFDAMKSITARLAQQLAEEMRVIDGTVEIDFKELSAYEFQLRFANDVLMFTLHTNVAALDAAHILLKNPYVAEDPHRGYFGAILVYNYMADSVRFNRLQDPGWLVGRMLLNKDSHFYVEGIRHLNFLHPDIAQNQVTEGLLREFVESTILLAIEQDLVAPGYPEIQVVPLGVKLATQVVSSGTKVGFQNSAQKA
jgi:hypothetical protein